MENESLFNNERLSIRDSARQLKKYGSTCNHVRNNEVLIRHDLEPSDTLQGIALKYGCTTEQIRRANRLFAQDSLFLRQHLMIPVDRDTSAQYTQNQQHQPNALSLSVTENDVASNRQQSNQSPTQSSSSSSRLTKLMPSDIDPVLSPEEESRKSMEEFLGKIDSTLAKTKKYVASSHVRNSQNGSQLFASLDEDRLENAHSSAAYALSNSQHNHRNGSYSENGNRNGTQMTTHGRRVKHSLHRLERQQDEFYQL